VRQIKVEGLTVGLMGLDSIFEQLYTMGRRAESSVGDELLAMVQAHNYIPRGSEAKYKRPLLREYASFCAERKMSENGRQLAGGRE
jgi:hypothetical protein